MFAPIVKESRQDLDDDDDDPVLMHLRFLNYRYIKFCFHPLVDKFILCGNWKDPSWKNVKSIRAGLDGEERIRRAKVFGKNQIDVQQKPLLELLVDEVSRSVSATLVPLLCVLGSSSILRVSDCQSHTLVARPILLLRRLHFHNIGC